MDNCVYVDELPAVKISLKHHTAYTVTCHLQGSGALQQRNLRRSRSDAPRRPLLPQPGRGRLEGISPDTRTGRITGFHSSSHSAEFSFLYAFVLDNVMPGTDRSTNTGEFILTVREK
jgi:hypothetical protein